MSILATPPRLMLAQQPTTLPADVLAALQDDSDEENDKLPLSLYFKPDELLDSPDKQHQQKQRLAEPLGPHSPNLLGDLPVPPAPLETTSRARSSSVLSRSASLAQTQIQPSRETRPFARVASVPASAPRKGRGSDTSVSPPPEDVARNNRLRRSGSSGSEEVFEPETPAPSNYLPRRPLSTVSRPTFASKQASRSEFPSVTPGVSSRHGPTASVTSSRLLRRPAGGSSITTTPESDSPQDRSNNKNSSPVPSPRSSPPPHHQAPLASSVSNPLNGTAPRQRLVSGRLAGPPVRTRLGGLASTVTDAVSERDEEDSRISALVLEREREFAHETEKQMDLERDAELERARTRERELLLEQAALEKEKEQRENDEMAEIMEKQRERLRERERVQERMTPPDDRVNHPDATPSIGRSRAASSSEHQLPFQSQAHPRAASALDHYQGQRQPLVPSSSKANGIGRFETLGGPQRPGQNLAVAESAYESSSSASQRPPSARPRVLRHVAGNASVTAVDPPRTSPPTTSSALSRQASAPNPSALMSGSMTKTPGPSHSSQPPGSATINAGRHRRNPTAPSPPATGNRLRRPVADDTAGSTAGQGLSQSETQKENKVGTTDKENEQGGYAPVPEVKMEREREDREKMVLAAQRQAPPPPVAMQQHQYQQQPEGPKRPSITVNRKVYQRLECIGRGGSSRVYRVVSPENAIYAIKRVSLENADQQTIEGYKNEISLLRRLEGNKRIIRLVEFDSTSSKKNLLMVMECGEVDLAKLLSEKQGEPVDFPWVTSQWQQMLQAVHVIHEEKIVHSDLKPANFVLVKGSLKLIDFGIAKAIPNDTTNIQREQQIGTVNYMSPEAIEGTHGMSGYKIMKLGRASDVWSLGCILYQMIYGHPPFYFLTMWQKMKAIPDTSHDMEFPAVAVPSIPGPRDPQTGAMGPPQRMTEHATPVPIDVINTMKKCLLRDPKKRPSIPELIQERWNMRTDVSGGSSTASSRPVSPTSLLRPDEAIIDANMMAQLLTFAYANPPPEINQTEIRKMVEGLLPALQNARKHHP